MRVKPFWSVKTFIFLLTVAIMAAGAATSQAKTKFKVLHTFHGANGLFPVTQLVRDSEGNFYGTTSGGGSGTCNPVGCGTVFKLNKNGTQVWLYSFNGSNGLQPLAGVVRDSAGSLYGTTVYGGHVNSMCGQLGCGVVFKLDKNRKETVLHRFGGGSTDGFFPEGLLSRDATGTLYGTTQLGGNNNGPGDGTVFKVDDRGRERLAFSFDYTDGFEPSAGVIADAAGNLFGTTAVGGAYRWGTVFELDSSGTETVLYNFADGPDGAVPSSGLVEDAAGNLYGTTSYGGNLNCGGGSGCGVVFELSSNSGGSWTEHVLYTFCSESGCADGEQPQGGPLVRDATGDLYGTTYFGGDSSCGFEGGGCGVVFKVDSNGSETVLHSFAGGRDGAYPDSGLIKGAQDTLYGTAEEGGDNRCNPPNGCGTVFKINQ